MRFGNGEADKLAAAAQAYQARRGKLRETSARRRRRPLNRDVREDVRQDSPPHLFRRKVEARREADHHSRLQACHVLQDKDECQL